ncbi:MAG: ribose ABC transporter permease [Thermotogaceae bacterium]|nr:ribose ABC transporter permease [Thermotogaceae bacterium]
MKKIWTLIRKYPVVFGFIVLVIVLSILSDSFFTISNFLNILRQASFQAILAFGMTIVIISGGIDLSVGSIFAFSAVILASILKTGSIFLAILACLGVGAAFGLFNGFVIAKAKLQPFIVTLATMAIARSFTLLYTNGMPITGFDERFTYIGQGEVLTIPIPVIIMFIIFFLTWYILSKTKIGLYTYSIGGNEEAARLSGVTVDRYKMLIYMISGIYSAIGSMILTARLDSAQPTFGQGYELDAIAAVVLGGASLKGGKGTVLGTLFGALIIGTINNGLNLLNISPFFQQAIKGCVILAAVLLEREK